MRALGLGWFRAAGKSHSLYCVWECILCAMKTLPSLADPVVRPFRATCQGYQHCSASSARVAPLGRHVGLKADLHGESQSRKSCDGEVFNSVLARYRPTLFYVCSLGCEAVQILKG